MLQRTFEFLAALPPTTLLSAMALLAALENLFPPIPADVLVAFGGFLAARAGHSPVPAFLAVWIGNVLGAGAMYWMGRRFGAAAIERRLGIGKGGAADARILAMHTKYGMAAFFVSRFVPGLRAVVPPVAGALRIPALGALVAISAASALWYGGITAIAFRTGANWDLLQQRVAQFGKGSAIITGVLLSAVVAVLWYRRRRYRDRAAS